MSCIKPDTLIDLTIPLDTSFIPYSKGKYTDPPLELKDWSSIQTEGFRVSRLSLGTQSGTHIDAPSHFLETGATLEALSLSDLMGEYFLLDIPAFTSASDMRRLRTGYQKQRIIFLRTPEDQKASFSQEAIGQLLSLPASLLVLTGEIEIENSQHFEFHRLVAQAGKYLVEDLDQRAAHRISGNGEIFAFPLRLLGASGSPCRVVVRIFTVA